MSTKSIREALRLLDSLSGESSELVSAAEAEVETIEKALNAWAEAGMPALDSEAAKKWSVVSRIAKEAP
jgi:hypothetical protein